MTIDNQTNVQANPGAQHLELLHFWTGGFDEGRFGLVLEAPASV